MSKHLLTAIKCEQSQQVVVPTEFDHAIVNGVIKTLGHCPDCKNWHAIDLKTRLSEPVEAA